MEHLNKRIPEKHRKNEDFCKKIWLSLFEWRILSSCQENDFDLFGASALLKSALHLFEKLKKRLNDSQNLVETLKFELQKKKLENDNFAQKLNDLNTTYCTHCQCLKGIQSYSEGCVWDSECHSQSGKGSKENCVTLGSLPLKSLSTEPYIQKTVIPVPEAHGCRECPPETSDGGGPVLQDRVSVAHPVLNVHDTPKLPSLTREEGICLPSYENLLTSEKTSLKTPEKKISPDHSIRKLSPVLNSQKRAKRFTVSPCTNGSNSKPPSKNARSPSCLMPGVESSEVEALCSKTALNSSSKDKGRCFNPKKKQKILSLRLKQEQRKGSQSAQSMLTVSRASSSMERCLQAASGTKEVESFPNTPPTKVVHGRHGRMGETTPLPTDKKPTYRSKAGGKPAPRDKVSPRLLFVPKSTATDEEDDELIMPSPNSLQGHNALIDASKLGDLVSVPCDNTSIEIRGGAHQLESHEKECHRTREPPQTRPETDTEVTYFAPKNESSEEEEESGGDKVIVSDGNMRDELPHCPHSDAVGVGLRPSRCLLTSFDRVPPKSPNFKHQRAAVRKKRDRMQMEGWECKACKKYYDAAGVEAKPHERKGHVNKCSRHRDRYSPRKCTPQGFWDPLFPETPEG